MATLTRVKTFTSGELVTPDALHQLVDSAAISSIVNADISASAAIADTKLAQIATAGKVANSATTATSAITANSIVARNSGGGISAQKGSFGTVNGFRVGVNENDNFPNNYMIFWNDATAAGSIVKGSGNSVSYNTVSDYRLKTNIEPLTAAVSRLLQIPVHRFNWLADPTAPKVDGFLAHEAQAIVPESVTGHKDEVDAEGKPVHQGIDQSKLVPLLVAAVQELAARVAALEAR